MITARHERAHAHVRDLLRVDADVRDHGHFNGIDARIVVRGQGRGPTNEGQGRALDQEVEDADTTGPSVELELPHDQDLILELALRVQVRHQVLMMNIIRSARNISIGGVVVGITKSERRIRNIGRIRRKKR